MNILFHLGLSPRKFRNWIGPILPEWLKKNFRMRLFGFGNARNDTDWDLNIVDDLVYVSGYGINFRMSSDLISSLEYHCKKNTDSVEELVTFVNAAKLFPGRLIDIGAAEGLMSIVYCAATDLNYSSAFEPSAQMLFTLRSNIKHAGFDNKISCVSKAVGDVNGAVAGRVSEGGMLVLSNACPENTVLEICTLDSEAAKYNDIKIIKVDVEGFEGHVLRGAAGTLVRNRPVLFLEFHLDALEKLGESPTEMLESLKSIGYDFYTCNGTFLNTWSIANSALVIIRFIACTKSDYLRLFQSEAKVDEVVHCSLLT